MVSQFVSPHNVRLLGDLDYDFPEGTHAVGRLDGNSEGLLILTTNKKVTGLLLKSSIPHERRYLIQVQYQMSQETLEQLRNGVAIPIQQGETYWAKPVAVEIVTMPDYVQPLFPHYRLDIPHTWLIMTLTEGKYHQVRKMVKAVNHPCKRLIRISIEDLALGNLPAGEVLELDEQSFFKQLNIDY